MINVKPESSKMTQIENFISDLEKISYIHGVGLAGNIIPFQMQPEDYERSYVPAQQDSIEFT